MLIDVILLLILVACVLSGYRKGLLMSLMSLVVVIVCCLGASAAQRTLTPKAVEYMEPKVASAIEAGIQEQLERSTQQSLEQAGDIGLRIGGESMTLGDLADFLGQFGIDVEEEVTESASNALSPAVAAAAQGAARTIVEQLAGIVIFFAAFLILYLVLHSAALAVNVVDRMPVIHTLNRAGGAVLGLCGGLLAITVAAAVILREGFALDEVGMLTQLFASLADRLL